jgi:benzoate-CoA ligase
MTRNVNAPSTDFNFAQHLIATNAGRTGKTALIDDVGTLTYGELTEQIRRFAGGLQAMGLKREERVLLLMQDSSDWVVAFLGALYAGVVPVAVNTLLTAEDYAFMLSNSRAQAALVSGALLPTLQAAMDLVKTEVRHVVVSRPIAALKQGQFNMADFVAQNTSVLPRRPWPMNRLFGCIPRAPPANPRAPCTARATCIGQPSCMAKGC